DREPRAPRALGGLALRMLELNPSLRLQDAKSVLIELRQATREAAPYLFTSAPEPVTERMRLPDARVDTTPAEQGPAPEAPQELVPFQLPTTADMVAPPASSRADG